MRPLSPPTPKIPFMRHVGDLLAGLELPVPDDRDLEGLLDPALLHDLGADLPAGHCHLWGGPPGAGKTAFLLTLIQEAARYGRRSVFATYHLPAETLALRLLAMVAGLDANAIAGQSLRAADTARAAAGRQALAKLPIYVLEARGMSAISLEDRLVRMPFRAEVMAIDYLQAVIRPEGQDLGGLVRDLSALATRLHVAVVATLKPTARVPEVENLADRAGWIEKGDEPGCRRAEVTRNRYGERTALGLLLDEATGNLSTLQ